MTVRQDMIRELLYRIDDETLRALLEHEKQLWQAWLEQDIAFLGAQNDDNLARTESLDTISEFSDGDTDESRVVPDDAPQEEDDSEDEASKDDDNGEEEGPEEEDDSKDEAPEDDDNCEEEDPEKEDDSEDEASEDDDDAIKGHPLFIEQGVTK